MTTILAHLSDLHLLEPGHVARSRSDRLRLAYLSFGRPLDAQARRERVRRALFAARTADHLVVTGDLTEDGTDAQLEALAQVLIEHGPAPERVTIVPGNHDAYTVGGAFERALDGPLRPYAETSRPGSYVELDGAVVVAASSAVHQPVSRSAGSVDSAQVAALGDAAADRGWLAGRALVVALHHPPLGHALGVANWVDGLAEAGAMRAMLDAHPHVHVLHGHAHRERDRAVASGRAPQTLGAAAVVDSDEPLRLYAAGGGCVVPIERGWSEPLTSILAVAPAA